MKLKNKTQTWKSYFGRLVYHARHSNSWATPYGRVLVLKIALVIGISICGCVNWQRLRRMHNEPSGSIIVLEAMLAAAVLLVTGFLTEIAHPRLIPADE